MLVEAPTSFQVLRPLDNSTLPVDKCLETRNTKRPSLHFSQASCDPHLSLWSCSSECNVLNSMVQIKSSTNSRWEVQSNGTGRRSDQLTSMAIVLLWHLIEYREEGLLEWLGVGYSHLGGNERITDTDGKQRRFLVAFHEHHVMQCNQLWAVTRRKPFVLFSQAMQQRCVPQNFFSDEPVTPVSRLTH